MRTWLKASAYPILVLLSTVAFFIFAGAQEIAPDRRMPPPPPPSPPMPHPVIQRDLTLTSMKVSVEIRGAVARTTIRQELRNDSSWVAEGTYMLPLPPGATVSDFALIDGDKRLTPQVLSAPEARRVYQDIVRKMRDPGLLEYQNNNAFSVSVFPFQPGQTRAVEVSFSQALSGTTGLVSYNMPLKWAAWSRMGTGGQGASFTLSYSIESDYDLGTISSPTFGITVNRDGNRKASGSFESNVTGFGSDFTLNIGRRTGDFAASLMCFPGDKGDNGYFLLSLLAALPKDEKYIPKDILVVFDKSGSMSGEKIEQTKGALRFILDKIKSEDRFGMVYYSDTVSKVFDGLTAANAANIGKARQVLDKLDADGGTDIMTALTTGAAMIKPDGRPCYVLFLTDGLPTVGDTDVNHIIAAAKERFDPNVKLFVFGVGYDVNTTLLDSLSYDHHGSASYMAPGEDIEVKVSQFYSRMSSPALTGIKLELSGLEEYDLMPTELPDLFHNSEIFITGRYRGAAGGGVKVSVSGSTDKGQKQLAADVSPSASALNHQVPRLWATRKVSYLIDQVRLHGDNKELLGEIDRLAVRYGIVTPYTSYLITEPGMFFDPQYRADSMEGNMKAAREEESGAGAVNRSKMSQANQAAGVAAAPQQAGAAAGEADDRAYVKYSPTWFGNYDEEQKDQLRRQGSANLENSINYVNNQTFILQQATNQLPQWVDARYDKTGQKAVRITTYGDEYFKLLDEFPQLSEYLSQGEQVVVTVSSDVALETTTDEVHNTSDELEQLRSALQRGEMLSQGGPGHEPGPVLGLATPRHGGGGGPTGWGWTFALGLLSLLGAALLMRMYRRALAVQRFR